MKRNLILAAISVAAFAAAACTPAAEDKAEATDGAMAPAGETMAPADGSMAPADGAMAPTDGAMPADGTMTPDEKMAADKMAADKMAPAQ